MTSTYKAHLWIDLRDVLKDKTVISFSMGYDGKLYILTMYSQDDVKYRTDNGMFARTHTDTPHDFIVYVATPNEVKTFVIPQQIWNYHSVQPLPKNELLLVCSRVNRHNKTKQTNGKTFSLDGTLRRSFSLGDAIESVRTTSIGKIWISYFDEAFHDINNVGLHRRDAYGHEVYRYHSVAGLNDIFDCYAMNVESDDTIWIYYYTDFPLVKIVDDRVVDYWYPPIKYSHGFAIYNNYVVFAGSRDNKLFHHYELLPNHQIEHIQTFEIENIEQFWYTTRGKTIVFSENNQFYRFDIPELLRRKNQN